MTQYVRCKIKIPKGTNVAELEKELISRGYEVEITGAFIQLLPGMSVPDTFKPNQKEGE